MLRSTALALCVVLLAWTAAHALDCKSDNLNQNELDQCAGQAFDRADKELNARYQKIVACLKDEAKLLVEAQRI